MVGDGGRGADGQLFDGCCGAADQLLDGCDCAGAGAELAVLPHPPDSAALDEGAGVDWPQDDETGWAAGTEVALPFSDGSCVDMAGCEVVSDPPASLAEYRCSMPGSGSETCQTDLGLSRTN